MVFAVKFAVEGMLRDCASLLPEGVESVLRALEESGISGARFDYHREIFSIELDPALVSWSDVRESVRRAGERDGRLFLAVVMSL
ncbi:MAG TPA: hypothetical protein VMB26_08075 [Candidatus Binataceae bacterium]|nr:hypothetical protein [Candidatus Binataceae bacterium]